MIRFKFAEIVVDTSPVELHPLSKKKKQQQQQATNCKVCKQITNLSSNYQLLSVMAVIINDAKERRIKFIKRKFVVYQVIYNLYEQKYIYI